MMNAHEVGGLWLLREMWGFPAGVPEDDRLDYLKAIMACARGDGELSEGERTWVIGYGAACGATQETVDALEAYAADEEVDAILNRNMPVAETWGRIAVYDAIRAASADHEYDDGERRAVRHVSTKLAIPEALVAALEAHAEEEQAMKRKRVALVFGDASPYQDRG